MTGVSAFAPVEPPTTSPAPSGPTLDALPSDLVNAGVLDHVPKVVEGPQSPLTPFRHDPVPVHRR